jgi:hypothetical protein
LVIRLFLRFEVVLRYLLSASSIYRRIAELYLPIFFEEKRAALEFLAMPYPNIPQLDLPTYL